MFVAVKQPAQPQACSLSAVHVGRAVGAEEVARVAGGRGGAQREAVLLALGDRQAVVVRPDAAREDVVAVDDEVVRRDRGRDVGAARADVVGAFAGRDVLHHDAEAGDVAADRVQHAVDEHGLAVEDVDGGVGDLAVDEEGQADLGHVLEHAADLAEVLHAANASWWWPPRGRASPP